MIDPTTAHRQRMALWRLRGPRVLCSCDSCLRCRKRAWMRAARQRRRDLVTRYALVRS